MRYAIAPLAAALITVGLAGGRADAQYTYRPQVAQDDAAVVTSWYQRYLGREPDQTGLYMWVNQLRRGAPVEASILGSDEYFERHGNTPESFVTGLYVEVLNRQPSAAEVQVRRQGDCRCLHPRKPTRWLRLLALTGARGRENEAKTAGKRAWRETSTTTDETCFLSSLVCLPINRSAC